LRRAADASCRRKTLRQAGETAQPKGLLQQFVSNKCREGFGADKNLG